MSRVLRWMLALSCCALLGAPARAMTPEEFASLEPDKALLVPAEEAIAVFGWRRQEYLFVLENALIDLRYLYRPPSGKPSKQLTAAIKAFQRERGMRATGALTVGQFMDLVKRGNEFWQAPVFAGPLQIEYTDDRVMAQGSWRPESGSERDPVQSSSVRCYRSANVCSMVTARLLMADDEGGWFHNAAIDLDLRGRDFAVTQWTPSRVVAQDTAMCLTYTLTIDFATQAAVIDTQGSGAEKCGGKPVAARRYLLSGGYEVTAPYWEARQSRLLKLRSREFQDMIARIQIRK